MLHLAHFIHVYHMYANVYFGGLGLLQCQLQGHRHPERRNVCRPG